MLERYASLQHLAACAALLAAIAAAPAHAVGSTPVTVVNPADLAKAQGIQQPFSIVVPCDPASSSTSFCRGNASAPAGQRLVIEYVSLVCRIDNTRQLLRSAIVAVTTGGVGISHYLTIPDRVGTLGDSGSGVNELSFGQPVRLYADAGSGLQLIAVATSNATSLPACFFALSGQAVGVP